MATFEYQARTKEGEARSGVIEASSEEAALNALQSNNLVVVSLHEKSERVWLKLKLPGKGIKVRDIVIFSRQLATLFEARIPVVEALKTLSAETSRPALREIISEIVGDVAGGLALSQAMAKHPNAFSAFYINMVRSGEESGKLQEVFSYLADYLDRSYYLTSKARNAMIYPAFVVIAFIGVFIVMLTVVIPRLVEIFEDAQIELPFYTKIILALSSGLQNYGFLVLILIIAGVILLWRWSYTPAGILFLHKTQISVPLVGELYKKLYMARLADNLQTLISGGIPILRALSITGDVVGNAVYQKAIAGAVESVRGGGTISAAFERVPEIPVLVTQMIKIGETAGRLDFILQKVAQFYQRDVDNLVENLVSLIEPILIIFLGVGVGVLVTAVLVPLYNLVGSL